jgi:hypothetical protein
MDNFDAVRELLVKPKTYSPVNPSGEPEGARVSGPLSQIRCRSCGEILTLNTDSVEAREAGTDPLQQMRRHILASHAMDLVAHARRCGFLIEMLFFEAVHDPEKWRKQIAEMVDYLLRERFNE